MRTQAEFDQSRREIKRKENELSRTRSEVSKTRSEASLSRNEVLRSRDEASRSQHEASRTKFDLSRFNADLRRTKSEVEQHRQEAATLRGDRKRMDATLAKLMEENTRLRSELKESSRLRADGNFLHDELTALRKERKNHMDGISSMNVTSSSTRQENTLLRAEVSRLRWFMHQNADMLKSKLSAVEELVIDPEEAAKDAAEAAKYGQVRYATMCILPTSSTNHAGWGHDQRMDTERSVALMCLQAVCALQLTTRPRLPPLVLVDARTERVVGSRLRGAGAQTVVLPPIPPWNTSGIAWSKRAETYRNLTEPNRMYTYSKLHLWNPALTARFFDAALGGPKRIVFFDADVLFLRDASELAHVPAPAALSIEKRCQNSTIYEFVGIFKGHIFIDNEHYYKHQYYWNSGVMVFEPGQAIYNSIMDTYLRGDFPVADYPPNQSEQDVLQAVYWRALGKQRPHKLEHRFNFRGYKCNYVGVNESIESIVSLHRSPPSKKLKDWTADVTSRPFLLNYTCGSPTEWPLRVSYYIREGRCAERRPKINCQTTPNGIKQPLAGKFKMTTYISG